MPRISIDDEGVLTELCERIIAGESVTRICADEHMPSERAIYVRMANDAEFCRVIARAREAQQDAMPDKIVDMADTATVEDWQVVKLRINALQWRAAKLAPKKYGEKVTNIHEGGEKPVEMVTRTDRERAKAMALLATKAKRSA